jgi:hypothetical protein
VINFYALVKGPLGTFNFESPWVSKLLDPSYKGYLWKKTLVVMCTEDSDMRWFENKLNQKFKSVFAALNHETLEEYDEFIPAIGAPPSAATSSGGNNQSTVDVHAQQSSTTVSEQALPTVTVTRGSQSTRQALPTVSVFT